PVSWTVEYTPAIGSSLVLRACNASVSTFSARFRYKTVSMLLLLFWPHHTYFRGTLSGRTIEEQFLYHLLCSCLGGAKKQGKRDPVILSCYKIRECLSHIERTE